MKGRKGGEAWVNDRGLVGRWSRSWRESKEERRKRERGEDEEAVGLLLGDRNRWRGGQTGLFPHCLNHWTETAKSAAVER